MSTDTHSEEKVRGLYDDEPKLKSLPFTFKTAPQWLLLGLIRLYQRYVSPLQPADTCRFYPSCSHYTYQSIYRFGFLKGSWMGFRRVLRCNPYNPGGFDPVPEKESSQSINTMSVHERV